MENKKPAGLVPGILLILFGAFLLIIQLIPGFRDLIRLEYSWPLIVVGVGLLLLLIGVFTREPGMAVPATIVGGIGLLLYYQNSTGDWGSWSYAWALIPGFVGLGIIFSGLWSGKVREALEGGGWLLLISAVMFAVFSSFFNGRNLLGNYWPVLLIVAGLLMLLSGFFRKKPAG